VIIILSPPLCKQTTAVLVFLRMKRILKSLVYGFIALFGAAQISKGFSYGNDVTVLIFAAVVFGMVNSFVKPILKAVTLPFNLLTLGFFSLVINAALLYLTTRIVPGLAVTGFHFSGLTVGFPFGYPDLVVNPLDIPFIASLFLTSITISVFMIVLGILFENG
jgi:putative membrane protein